ncbi:MAG: acyltransferase family protein [Caulobacteraceae bacterium]
MAEAASAVPSENLPGPLRLGGLDLLRAIAISWVMLYHASIFGLAEYTFPIVNTGWIGVDIFFVLSGFLIGSQFFRPMSEGRRIDWRRFYIRRVFRTFPAYTAILIVYFTIPSLREFPRIQPAWQFLTFSENIFISLDQSKSFSHVWSLCVEEQFYLFMPVVIALLTFKYRLWKVMATGSLMMLGGMVLRGLAWLRYVAPFDVGRVPLDAFYINYTQHVYYPTWNRLDGLLFGVAAAALCKFRPERWNALLRRPNVVLVAGVSGLLCSIFFFGDQDTHFLPAVLGYPLLSGSIMLIVAAATHNDSVLSRFPVPGAASLAAISYSLYLSHKIVFHAFAVYASPQLTGHPLIGLAGAVLSAIIIGLLLYWTVEHPFLSFRDKLTGRSQASVSPTAHHAPIEA